MLKYFSSITQSCLTLCELIECSTPGSPAHHQFPELPQTHLHRVGDAIPTISSSVIPFFSYLPSFPPFVLAVAVGSLEEPSPRPSLGSPRARVY